MNGRMKKISILFAALAAFAASMSGAAENDVLYWMVGDGAAVTRQDGTQSSIQDFFNAYDAAHSSGDTSFAARVRVTGGNVSGDVFLDIYMPDGSGSFEMWSGDLGVDFGDSGSGYWGAGVPVGNQSPSGDYSAGTPEYAFTVELGHIVWDSGDNGSWTTLATSAPSSYSSLGQYIGKTFDMNPVTAAIWTPMQFNEVPEPSGGVMTALGLALLALRRRRSLAV